MRNSGSDTPKTLGTRLFHMGLAIAIIVQLLSSLAMQAPRGDRAGNALFIVHNYSGLAAIVLALGFWLVVFVRRSGTETGMLVPWFSQARRDALLADLRDTYGVLRTLRLPEYKPDSPLASAIHGLGLLLMTGMALSGTVYYVAGLYGVQKTLPVELVIELHGLFANLVWAYLIGHVAMASIHQISGDMRIGSMWSLRSGKD